MRRALVFRLVKYMAANLYSYAGDSRPLMKTAERTHATSKREWSVANSVAIASPDAHEELGVGSP